MRTNTLVLFTIGQGGGGREKRLKNRLKKVALIALLTMIVGHFRPLSIRVLPTQA